MKSNYQLPITNYQLPMAMPSVFSFPNFRISKFSNWLIAFSLLSIVCGLSSCKVYSFTGANIPADVHTVSVEMFQNRASNGPASLSQSFTDKLKFKMQTEANLRQVASEGDLQFSGSISGYTYTSDAPVANATSGLNKLTITVQVHFVNSHDEKDKWDQTFSRYAQYSASDDISSVEDRLIGEINTQLVDDIFQKALVKW